ILAGPHESMACAIVGHRIILLTSLLHGVLRCGDGRVDTRVISSVKPVHWPLDFGHVVGRLTIKYERRCEVGTIGREPKTLSATPAEAGYCHLPIGCGKLLDVVRRSIQVGSNCVGIQLADRIHYSGLVRKIAGSTALRSHS